MFSFSTISTVGAGDSKASLIVALRSRSSSIIILCIIMHALIMSYSTSFLQKWAGPATIANRA